MKKIIEELQTLVDASDLIVFNGKHNTTYFENPVLMYKDEHKKSPLYPNKTIWLSSKTNPYIGSLLICNESHFNDEAKTAYVKSLLDKMYGFKSIMCHVDLVLAENY